MKGYLRFIVCCEKLLGSIYFMWSANTKGPEIASLEKKKWGKHRQVYNIPVQILMSEFYLLMKKSL